MSRQATKSANDPTRFSDADKARLDEILKYDSYKENLPLAPRETITRTWRLRERDDIRWNILLLIYISSIGKSGKHDAIRRIIGHQRRLWFKIPNDAIEGIYLEAKKTDNEHLTLLWDAVTHFKEHNCLASKDGNPKPCKTIIESVPGIQEQWSELARVYVVYQEATREIELGAPPEWNEATHMHWFEAVGLTHRLEPYPRNLFKDPPDGDATPSSTSGRISASSASRGSLQSQVSGKSQASDPFRDPENPFADSAALNEMWEAYAAIELGTTTSEFAIRRPESIKSTESSSVAQGKKPAMGGRGRSTSEISAEAETPLLRPADQAGEKLGRGKYTGVRMEAEERSRPDRTAYHEL